MPAKIDPAEVDRVARLIAREDATSSHALRPYLQGNTTAAAIVPVLKRRLLALINSPERKISSPTRLAMLEFAAKYGLRIRNTDGRADPEELRSVEMRVRFTPEQAELIRRAAADADLKPATWVAMIAVDRADPVTT